MSRVDYLRYKQQLVLYITNVYQPCTEARLRDIVRESSIKAFKGMTDEELSGILQAAEEGQLLIRTATGQGQTPGTPKAHRGRSQDRRTAKRKAPAGREFREK